LAKRTNQRFTAHCGLYIYGSVRFQLDQDIDNVARDGGRQNEMRSLFKEKRYAEVVALVDEIKYAELMNESQRRIVELARKRAGS
jgi:hypothetical protein